MRRPLFVGCLTVILLMIIFLLIIPPSRWNYQALEGNTYLYTGQVYKRETAEFMQKQQSKIYLKNISVYNKSNNKLIQKLPGAICYGSIQFWPKMGSEILVEGKFKNFQAANNPGEFDSAFYYQILELAGEIKDAKLYKESSKYSKYAEFLSRVNHYFECRIKDAFSEDAQGIMKTMLLGNKADLDKEIKEGYKDAGILHVLSVSGLHISILGYGLFKSLRKLGMGNRCAALGGMVFILSYGIMIGMGVSAFRAIFMFMIQMIAKCIGRTYDLLTALALAAVLLLLEQPLYLYHSGFQLSFGCVLSISVFCQILQWEMKKNNNLKKFANAFLFSVGISVATLPVFLWFYFEISLIGMFLNLIVIPLMSVIMYAGIGTLLIPVGLRIFQFPMVMISEIILKLYWWLCENGTNLFFSKVILGRPQLWQIIIYLLGLLILIWFHKKIAYLYRWVVIAILILVLTIPFNRESQITFLDVGQGDGICLQTKEGKTYLFDGGSSDKSKIGERVLIPYLKYQGIRHINAIFISHSDEDHMNGIVEMVCDSKGISIDKIYIPEIHSVEMKEKYRELILLCKEKNIKLYELYAGMTLKEEEIELVCLNPQKGFVGGANEGSLAFYIRYGKFTGLMAADVEGIGETQLLEEIEKYNIRNITFLKVAHHGSENSTKDQLLQILKPQIAVISCGKNNTYGHPHEELMKRLSKHHINIYRTDQAGAITLTFYTQSERVNVDKYR